MCIINNAAKIITLIATILYGAVVRNLAGQTKHILGYYNTIKEPSTGGNAMLIAIPVQQSDDDEELPVRLIETSDMPNFMTDLKKAVEDDNDMVAFSIGASRGISKGIVIKNFDNGLYDVVIAGRAEEITSLLKDVDPAKRPEANPGLYKELDTVYLEEKGFIFLVFCFNGNDSGKVAGALIEYTPADPTKLFLPALEGHQGRIERGKVRMDHAIVVGTDDMRDGSLVTYTDKSIRNERPYYLLDRVVGVVQERTTRQGDFVVDVESLREGNFECVRTVPTGWNKLSDTTATEPQRIKAF